MSEGRAGKTGCNALQCMYAIVLVGFSRGGARPGKSGLGFELWMDREEASATRSIPHPHELSFLSLFSSLSVRLTKTSEVRLFSR